MGTLPRARLPVRSMAPPVSDILLLGFDHVDLRVPNRPKARRFFVDQLGMDVIGEGADHTFLLFGDQVLGLRDAAGGARPDGIDHIALRVADWTGLRNRVKRARIEVTGEKERDESRSLYLKGPDGLQVELVWRPDPHVHPAHEPPPAVAPPEEDAEPEGSPPRRPASGRRR